MLARIGRRIGLGWFGFFSFGGAFLFDLFWFFFNTVLVLKK